MLFPFANIVGTMKLKLFVPKSNTDSRSLELVGSKIKNDKTFNVQKNFYGYLTTEIVGCKLEEGSFPVNLFLLRSKPNKEGMIKIQGGIVPLKLLDAKKREFALSSFEIE
nr:hypothetical protein Iba_chr04bCG18830 [Ipomoea batatas]GMC87125.1 hypothetical protein Iba_chr04dCG17250 [Ipomoea batatas]